MKWWQATARPSAAAAELRRIQAGTMLTAAEGDRAVKQIVEVVVRRLEAAGVDVDPIWDLVHAAVRPHAEAAVRAAMAAIEKIPASTRSQTVGGAPNV